MGFPRGTRTTVACVALLLACMVPSLHAYPPPQFQDPSEEDKSAVWDILELSVRLSAGSSVNTKLTKALETLKANPEHKLGTEALISHYLAREGNSPSSALNHLTTRRPQAAKRVKRETHSTRAAPGSLLSYNPLMVKSIQGYVANSTWNYEPDTCGSDDSVDVLSSLDSARKLSQGLQHAAYAARCVCRVAPKCIVIIPILIEIPTFFFCVLFPVLIPIAESFDYNYQHQLLCANVRLEKIYDKINLLTQQSNGLLAEMDRYQYEEQIFEGIENPMLVETDDRGGRIEFVLSLVRDVVFRRDTALKSSKQSYNSAELNAASDLIDMVKNGTISDEDRPYNLITAYRKILAVYQGAGRVRPDFE